MLTKRRLLVASGAAVGVVLATVAVLMIGRDSGGGQQAAPTTTTFTSSDAQVLESALTGGDPTAFAAAVALLPGDAVDPGALAAFADLDLDLDASTLVTQPDGTALVRATTRGGEEWTVGLARQDGSWKIVATQRGWAP